MMTFSIAGSGDACAVAAIDSNERGLFKDFNISADPTTNETCETITYGCRDNLWMTSAHARVDTAGHGEL
jgi:hypothetical protein